MATVKYHSHGGYYGDGNSCYWTKDSILDTVAHTVTESETESLGGQLADNHQNAHSKSKTENTRDAIMLTPEQQNSIVKALQPLIDTATKYPHLEHFRLFSTKHFHFFTGRVAKARKIAEQSDYHGYNCLRDIFVLPAHDLIITYYSDSKGYNFRSKGYNFTVEHLSN